MRGLVRQLGRPALGIADQFINAGTNVVTAYAASLLLRPAAFGEFVLAFACVTMVLAAGRGLLGSTIVVHLPAQEPTARSALVRSVLGFTLLVGLPVSGILALCGGFLLSFAPWIIFALVQDVGRYVFLADRRVGAALALDLSWALAQAAAVAVWVLAGGSMGVEPLTFAWGIGACAGVVVFAVMVDARPGSPRLWVRATRDVAGWFTAVAVVGSAELYAVLLLSGILLGDVETGGLRAVQLLTYQPALVVAGALIVLLTPGVVHARESRSALVRASQKVAVAITPVIAMVGLIAVFHEPLMSFLFSQYTAFGSLVIPIALQAVLIAAALPAIIVLRALRCGRSVFLAQVLRIVLMAGGGAVGAVVGGVAGVAWFLAIGTLLSTAQVSVSAYRTTRRTVVGP